MVIIYGYFAIEKMNAKGEKVYVIDHQITWPCSFHETPNPKP
jgi:hypothetical protein